LTGSLKRSEKEQTIKTWLLSSIRNANENKKRKKRPKASRIERQIERGSTVKPSR